MYDRRGTHCLFFELQGAEAGGVRGGVLMVFMGGPGEAGVELVMAEGDRVPLFLPGCVA